MAMPQRDELIDEIQKTDLLLEYAVQHGEVEEGERLRAKLRRLAAMGDQDELTFDNPPRLGVNL